MIVNALKGVRVDADFHVCRKLYIVYLGGDLRNIIKLCAASRNFVYGTPHPLHFRWRQAEPVFGAGIKIIDYPQQGDFVINYSTVSFNASPKILNPSLTCSLVTFNGGIQRRVLS